MKPIIKISPFLHPRKSCQRHLCRGGSLLGCPKQVDRGPCSICHQEPGSHATTARNLLSLSLKYSYTNTEKNSSNQNLHQVNPKGGQMASAHEIEFTTVKVSHLGSLSLPPTPLFSSVFLFGLACDNLYYSQMREIIFKYTKTTLVL